MKVCLPITALFLILWLNSCVNNPKVLLKTEFGDVICEIYEAQAPVTAKNFLQYVDENRFKGAMFYRVVTDDNQPDNEVKIAVVQGGLFDDIHPGRLKPIKHETTQETGILHKDGVISMARLEPGSATSEFFICVGDQPELDFGGRRNPDGQGFAAFGRVVFGMEVIRRIHGQSNHDQYLDHRVKIASIERVR